MGTIDPLVLQRSARPGVLVNMEFDRKGNKNEGNEVRCIAMWVCMCQKLVSGMGSHVRERVGCKSAT